MAIWQTNNVTITGLPYVGSTINLHSVFTAASDASGVYLLNTEVYDAVTKALLKRFSESVTVTAGTVYTRILTLSLSSDTFAAGTLLFKQGVFQTDPSPALLAWNDAAGGITVAVAPAWTATRYTVSKQLPVLNDTITISTTITGAATGNYFVGIDVRDTNGSRYKKVYNSVTFAAVGDTAVVSTTVTFALPGRYYFETGIFDSTWHLVAWITSDYFFNILGSTVAPAPPETDPTFRRGVTLSGSEASTVLPGLVDVDYQYPSALLLDYYQAAKLNTLRLPFRWERLQPTLNGPLDQAEVSRIAVALRNMKSRGMQGILTMHNFGGRIMSGTFKHIEESGGPTRAQFADVWGKIATVFGSETGLYAVDLMWQVSGMPASNTWLLAARDAFDAIRAVTSAATLNILVQGDLKSKASQWATDNSTFDMLRPNTNLFYEVVVWFDSNESGQYATNYAGSGASSSTGTTRLQPFVDWLTANTGYKGFVGAYGVPRTEGQWQAVLENMLGLMDDSNLGGTAWLDGERIGANPLSVGPIAGVDSPTMTTLLLHLGQQNIF